MDIKTIGIIKNTGTLPKDVKCPFLKSNEYKAGCGKWFCQHEVNNRVRDFSCGMARAFAISY
ncbi:hypothetical protein [Sulfurovum sp.]|uniref:hypothetical protein n=1 Tax=Sulfurovum sp. TaxID=1969726 RepID=UPI00356A3C06